MNEIFKFRYRSHNHINLLAEAANEHLHVFIPVLQGVGLVFMVWSNYALLALYDKMEKLLISFCLFLTIVFSIVNLLLLRYAAGPFVASEKTIWYWKGKRLGKVERKQVKAMRVIGIGMGPFFKIRNRSAMDVMNTILDYTVSMRTSLK